jgi:TPR repeat protein
MAVSVAMVGAAPQAMAQTSGPRASCLSFPQPAPLDQRLTEALASSRARPLSDLASDLYRATNGTQVDWAESARLSRLVMQRTEHLAYTTYGARLWEEAAKTIRRIHEIGLYGAPIDFAEIERIYQLEEARGLDRSEDRARTDRLRRGFEDYLTGLALSGAGEHVGALERLRLAGEAGVVQAQYLVGSYYMGERFVEANFPEAVRWFEMAARRDHSEAMYYLSVLLYGDYPGVTQSQRDAIFYLYNAAQRNHAYAMLGLGLSFQNGIGGLPRNRDEALCWYRRALAAGNDVDGSRREAQALIDRL